MSARKLSVQVGLDQTLSPYTQSSTRVLEVSLQAPPPEALTRRAPLNLALVLDRSGSMSGDKLESVKQAALHVVDLLKETDRVALVTYDDEVRVVFPSAALDAKNRQVLKNAIRSIVSGGSTNLFGGWMAGCEQVAKASQKETINRTLLLTDGLANVGVIDPEELAGHARELAIRGVFTSTFGVGYGFNHHLLEAMANQGEGRFYFIESPVAIPSIFESEFKELMALFAREIEVTLVYPPALQVSVPGGWRQECPEPGKLRVALGSLPAGRTREVYFKLGIPAGELGAGLPLKVIVRAKGPAETLIEAEVDLEIRLAEPSEATAAPKDEELLTRFAEVELADKAAEALKLEQAGRRHEAHDMLMQAAAASSPHLSQDKLDHYRQMSERMQHGMDEADRKRSHAQTYHQKQRRQDQDSE